MENSIIISNSRETIRISINQLLYIEADGNYSNFFWIDTKPHSAKTGTPIETCSVTQIGEIHKIIEKLKYDDRKWLVRIGRSLIVNLQYLYRIDLTEAKIYLMDRAHKVYPLSASREALADLKKEIDK